MTTMNMSLDNLKALKRRILPLLPDVRSSHLDQALAAAVGFRTYAAAIEHLPDATDFPKFARLDEQAFFHRLEAVGGTPKRKLGEIFERVRDGDGDPLLRATERPNASDIKYASGRSLAWRNAIVAAVNAGLEQRLFSLSPGDNRWPGWSNNRSLSNGYVFEFAFNGNVPAFGYVSDAGYDELSIHVALWPTERGRENVRAFNAGFHAGDLFAITWLERKVGAYIQTTLSDFRCRQRRVHEVASASVEPHGFGDRGKVIM